MNQEHRISDTVVLHAVGDVAPGRVEYGEEPESLMALVAPRIREADISFCQLERSLSERGCPLYRDYPTRGSRVHPDNVRALTFAGFTVASNASNHCFDFGPAALLDTIETLKKNGICVIGVGRDIADARKPTIIERKGARVAFLAYNSVLPAEYEARDEKPGCAPIRISTYYEPQEYQPGTPPKTITIASKEDLGAMEDDIGKARDQADVVVVSMHWGIHFIPGMLAMYQPEVGHRAVDAGADLILGHHAHIVKGIEVYKGKVIFYSLGNFALERATHGKRMPGVIARDVLRRYRQWATEPGWERYPGPRDMRYSMMVKCLIRDQAIYRVSFLPAWLNQRAEPEILPRADPRFDEVLGYVEPWCKNLGTSLRVEGDEVLMYPSLS